MFTQIAACNKCHGHGTFVEERCSECNGRGILQKTRNIELKIPSGIDDGSQLRLAGEGEAGASGSGDLYVVVHVKKHQIFNRRGRDLHLIKEITFPEAAIGTKIDVETISGKEDKIKIPEGTQNGDILKVSGQGMPGLRGRGHGDLYVEIYVKTPKKLTRKAKKLLEELNNELNN
jgi:molecular chaperone DnaJ